MRAVVNKANVRSTSYVIEWENIVAFNIHLSPTLILILVLFIYRKSRTTFDFYFDMTKLIRFAPRFYTRWLNVLTYHWKIKCFSLDTICIHMAKIYYNIIMLCPIFKYVGENHKHAMMYRIVVLYEGYQKVLDITQK